MQKPEEPLSFEPVSHLDLTGERLAKLTSDYVEARAWYLKNFKEVKEPLGKMLRSLGHALAEGCILPTDFRNARMFIKHVEELKAMIDSKRSEQEVFDQLLKGTIGMRFRASDEQVREMAMLAAKDVGLELNPEKIFIDRGRARPGIHLDSLGGHNVNFHVTKVDNDLWAYDDTDKERAAFYAELVGDVGAEFDGPPPADQEAVAARAAKKKAEEDAAAETHKPASDIGKTRTAADVIGSPNPPAGHEPVAVPRTPTPDEERGLHPGPQDETGPDESMNAVNPEDGMSSSEGTDRAAADEGSSPDATSGDDSSPKGKKGKGKKNR